MTQIKILNKANFKIWSRLGMRATFGIAALELGNTVKNLMILTGDVSTSAGLDRFKKKFPEKWEERFNSPAGLTGIAQVVGKFNLDANKRLELESLYSEVYMKGNVLKADLYIFFSTIILLLFHDSVAYRSYESAKNVLSSCLNK